MAECTGKRRYFDKTTAENRARDWAVRNKCGPQRAYQCPRCGWWHLTSQVSAPGPDGLDQGLEGPVIPGDVGLDGVEGIAAEPRKPLDLPGQGTVGG